MYTRYGLWVPSRLVFLLDEKRYAASELPESLFPVRQDRQEAKRGINIAPEEKKEGEKALETKPEQKKRKRKNAE